MSRAVRAWIRPFGLAGLACFLLGASPRCVATQVHALPEQTILQQAVGDRDPGDRFGHAIASAGLRVVIGAPGDDERGVDAGAAYVFAWSGGAWHLEAKLMPASLMPGDAFGSAVAIDESRLSGLVVAVGAPGDDRHIDQNGIVAAQVPGRGAAYSFVRSDTGWSLAQRLQPTGGPEGPGDAFGAAVAVLEGEVAVGAPLTDVYSYFSTRQDAGMIYVFGSDGVRLAQLWASRYEDITNRRLGATLAFGSQASPYDLRAGTRGAVQTFRLVRHPTWVAWTPLAYYAQPTYQSSTGDGVGFNAQGGGHLQATSAGMRAVAGNTIRQVSADGRVTTVGAWTYSPNGQPAWVDGRIAFRVWAEQVWTVAPDGTETFLAGDPSESFEDGVGIDAGFGTISETGPDGVGGLYVIDAFTIRHVAANGAVTTRAGLQYVPGSTDGIGSVARLTSPRAPVWDPSSSTLYFFDGGALRALKNGNEVVTVAGSVAQAGHADGSGADARLTPAVMTVAPDGAVIVGETTSIRRVTLAGEVTTLIPRGSSAPRVVDGIGANARVKAVTSLAYDANGVLFISDDNMFRTLSPSLELRTIAGLPIDLSGIVGASHAVDGADLLVGGPDVVPPTAAEDDSSGIVWRHRPGASPYPIFPRSSRDPAMNFGTTIGVSEGTVLVGSVRDTGSGPAIPVMGFDRDADEVWTQTLTLAPVGVGMGPDYGAALATNGPLVFVGSPATTAADGGFVAVFDLSLRDSDADGLSDGWETAFGLDPRSAAGPDGASGDTDGDGVPNVAEFEARTHPSADPQLTRYLAEGATTWTFSTLIALANPGQTEARVQLRFLRADGGVRTHALTLPPLSSRRIPVELLPDMDGAEFSTMIESDVLIAVDRVMWWPRNATGDASDAYGSHAERAVAAPATQWYFAEGATHSGFNLFYLLQNPSASSVDVRVRYLRPVGPPIEKTYTLAPLSRTNIWVDVETFDTTNGPATLLDNTDVAAVFTVQGSTGIIVERALYRDGANGRPFEAGHESAGVTAPATAWFLAEGATGDMFDTFVLVANPTDGPATVRVSFLVDDGRTFTRDLAVAANARTNIWVDLESFDGGQTYPLANAAFSTTLTSTNGVPIIVERSLWWPGPTFSTWAEAHNSFGATETGLRWVAAYAEAPTYLLVANPGTSTASLTVTLLGATGGHGAVTFSVAPQTRFNIDLGTLNVGSDVVGVMIDSVGPQAAPLVIERATYSTERGGMTWGAGTVSLLTRVQ